VALQHYFRVFVVAIVYYHALLIVVVHDAKSSVFYAIALPIVVLNDGAISLFIERLEKVGVNKV